MGRYNAEMVLIIRPSHFIFVMRFFQENQPPFRLFSLAERAVRLTFSYLAGGFSDAANGGAAHALQDSLRGWVSSAASLWRRGSMRPVCYGPWWTGFTEDALIPALVPERPPNGGLSIGKRGFSLLYTWNADRH